MTGCLPGDAVERLKLNPYGVGGELCNRFSQTPWRGRRVPDRTEIPGD